MKKPKVQNKLVRSQYLSEQEEKLAKFCQENDIKFVKRADLSGRGKTHYELDFKPEFLDETEAWVAQHLDRTGIRYKFAVDKGGTHHYEFSEMLTLEPLDRTEVIIDRKYVEARMSEMPKLRRNYNREVKLVENDTDIKFYKDKIEKAEKEVAALKEKLTPPTAWEKAFAYVWKPYKVKKQNEENKLKAEIKKLQDKIEDFKSSITRVETEKKLMREMLILADIWDANAEMPQKTVPLDEAEVMKEADELLKKADRVLMGAYLGKEETVIQS